MTTAGTGKRSNPSQPRRSLPRKGRGFDPLRRSLAAIGRGTLATISYLGALKLLTLATLRATIRPPRDAPPLRRAVSAQLAWMLSMGLPLTVLVHVSLGGFLAMQSYYGATFILATGPVVLTGLIRNLSPVMAGLILVGMVGTRCTAELARQGFRISPAYLTAARFWAAVIAGPILGLAGTLTGSLAGAAVAYRWLGVSVQGYFEFGWEMVWFRDVVGLLVKGMLFGGATVLIAALEGLRITEEQPPLERICFRACLISVVALIFLNTSWFLLIYRGGAPFGPTVLPPPSA
ncbi:protein of unknown function DUF140 [Isosphaera pallida ATCC 43644]|jgi:phospholipid/cholesterol/gamma-HCH transport system permease protein|uniref:ABC transporter permease n=1 Tax=Isosphaera pallida (strain ATCC 43644 / DSM 9630 / IS1B) TaxID=575540 RepID=E8R418_ISOPI|nr:ABC transporter permease [Isosphaera pallida]ADV61605.1 protein of unknown function DUF140 [Isosphaera pallida ATCC 43644]